MAHKVFIAFLLFIGLTAVLAVGVNGYDYYSAPVKLRAFNPEHKFLKPSGVLSHGLGIVGASMIIIGIIMYSTRKRVRALWNLGKLSVWLEVHIFLCLLGPVLVMYHTTFKAGGIAAISLWSMLSVAMSGIVGRFLYVLIPRTASGSEMTTNQINEQFDAQEKILLESEIGRDMRQMIDRSFAKMKRPENISQTVGAFLHLQKLKRQVRSLIHSAVRQSHVEHKAAHKLVRVASARATLIQKSLLLIQVEKLFYYWHAIHLPFTAIMLVTLAAHIGVALWLGYSWIF
jgi:hypothetical protein